MCVRFTWSLAIAGLTENRLYFVLGCVQVLLASFFIFNLLEAGFNVFLTIARAWQAAVPARNRPCLGIGTARRQGTGRGANEDG